MPLATAMVGMDLAALTITLPGPVAAPAIFQRLLTAGREDMSATFSLQKVVDAFPADHFDVRSNLKDIADLCPVLTALCLAAEIGESPNWHASFSKTVGIEVTLFLSPLGLAMQIYREMLLVALLSG